MYEAAKNMFPQRVALIFDLCAFHLHILGKVIRACTFPKTGRHRTTTCLHVR